MNETPETPESRKHRSPIEGANRWMRWANVAWTFIGSFVMSALIGYGIDNWLASSPVGVIVGAGIGFTVGAWIAVREVLRLANTD